MLLGMLGILATWFVLWVALSGLGWTVRRWVRAPVSGGESLLSSFWIGWAVALLVIQLWHCVAPIDVAAVVVIMAVGMAGFVWNARALWRIAASAARPRLAVAVGLVVVAAWLANRAMGPIRPPDAGLYHLSSIRWASEYSLVPGLANLHSALGYNSAHFLFIALLDVGPWRYMAHHVANGLLLLALSLQIGLSLWRLMTKRGAARPSDLVRAVFAIPVVHLCFVHASGTAPDLPVFVLGVVIAGELCKLLFDDANAAERTFGVAVVMGLSAAGLAVKLSFAPLGMAASLIAAATLFIRQSGGERPRIGALGLAALAAPAVAMVVVWAARGVVLTGYLVYPSTAVAFDVDWRLLQEHAEKNVDLIRHWARVESNCGQAHWLGSWAKRMAGEWLDMVIPVCLAAVGAIAALCSRGRGRARVGAMVALLAPAVLALVFWFFTAPDPRFAGAAIWWITAACVLTACMRWGFATWSRRATLGVLVLTACAWAAHYKHEGLVVPPGSARGFHPIPTVEMRVRTTRSGLEVYVPREGVSCWAAPLPCTPYFNADLRLRKKGNMTGGFMSSPQEENRP